MTNSEARCKGLPSGWILRLDQDQGMQLYLADYRQSDFPTTPYPSFAEYFRRLIDACEVSDRVRHQTGQRFMPMKTEGGATEEECRDDDQLTDAEYAMALEAAIEAFTLRDTDEDSDDVAIRTVWGAIKPRWESRDATRNN
jgi:hypothetical protein